MNVAELGLADMGMELCARILGFPDFGVGKRVIGGVVWRSDVFNFGGDRGWDEWNLSDPGGDHFPYGTPVEPDH